MPHTLVYGSVPHVSGTFTFYQMLRSGLAQHGWDVRCVSIGAQEVGKIDAAFVDDGCVQLAGDVTDRKAQTQAFVAWCAEYRPDVVMPMNSVAMLSALRHLPSTVSIVSRCPNTSDYGYAVAATYAERIARVVGTTPRHVRDLTARGVSERAQTALIPHGIDPAPYVTPERGTHSTLRIGFLGRVEHNFKGALYLPPLIGALAEREVDFSFEIAGDGEHMAELREQTEQTGQSDRVTFHGRLDSSQVPAYLSTLDVLVFPSRSEGFGFVLLQALAAGAVPVASRLEGVTDFILRDGETGFLGGVGDVEAFADAIARLDRDRDLLRTVSRAGAWKLATGSTSSAWPRRTRRFWIK